MRYPKEQWLPVWLVGPGDLYQLVHVCYCDAYNYVQNTSVHQLSSAVDCGVPPSVPNAYIELCVFIAIPINSLDFSTNRGLATVLLMRQINRKCYPLRSNYCVLAKIVSNNLSHPRSY